jgi:hypothetical protein
MPEAREAETLTCTPEVHPAEKNTFLKIVGACNCLLISVTVTRILIVIVAATTSPFIQQIMASGASCLHVTSYISP